MVTVKAYNHYLLLIEPSVEAYTGTKWELDEFPQIDDFFIGSPPNYHFMAYVRPHGFPSPLLDWSQSLYTALFFAFRKA